MCIFFKWVLVGCTAKTLISVLNMWFPNSSRLLLESGIPEGLVSTASYLLFSLAPRCMDSHWGDPLWTDEKHRGGGEGQHNQQELWGEHCGHRHSSMGHGLQQGESDSNLWWWGNWEGVGRPHPQGTWVEEWKGMALGPCSEYKALYRTGFWECSLARDTPRTSWIKTKDAIPFKNSWEEFQMDVLCVLMFVCNMWD